MKSRTKRLGVGKPCERDKDDIPLNRPDDVATAGAYAPDAAVIIDNGGDRKRRGGIVRAFSWACRPATAFVPERRPRTSAATSSQSGSRISKSAGLRQ